ncbi:hypothetical protein BJ165DRAFT_1508536 [Panaeolus papilionaceus]|nr:hypothetical protein BJ165DRAFT_1508536 [Panaeolus papilionaceus]
MRPLDTGGRHTVVVDSGVVANFIFTGVCIQFLSTLWPTPLSTSLSVEPSASTSNITIRPLTLMVGRLRVESGEPQNGEHTLIIGAWTGKGVAVVHTLM